MKKTLLFFAAAAMAASASAQIADGQYAIYNPDLGYYLFGGHSWGTAAVLTSEIRFYEIINNGDGSSKVKSSLGWWKGGGETFLDGREDEAANFEFVKDGDFYLIKHNGNFFTINEKYDFKDGEWWNWRKACHQNIQWTIKHVSQSEATKFQLITPDEMKANLAKATPENPMDASFMLENHFIAKNDATNVSGWNWNANGAKADVLIPDPWWIYPEDDHWASQDTYAFCINDKHDGNTLPDSEDVVMQEAEGLPAGNYEVVYRVVNQGNTPLEVKVNDATCEPANYADSDLWYLSAAESLQQAEKRQDFTVGQDGKVAITMTKQAKAGEQNRFAFKNFNLYYKGSANTGVEAVAADENAPVEYFNLQGVRVINPEQGIYLKRQGSKVTKILIK